MKVKFTTQKTKETVIIDVEGVKEIHSSYFIADCHSYSKAYNTPIYANYDDNWLELVSIQKIYTLPDVTLF